MKYLKALALAAALSLTACTSGANAADKGGPPVKVDATGNVKQMYSGCYVGGGVSGAFLTDGVSSESIKAFTAGGGCDMTQGRVVFGAGLDYSFGENDARMLTLNGRVGWLLNPHTLAYGLAAYTMDGRSPDLADGIISIGGGIETYLDAKVTLFLQATTEVKSVGELKGLKDATMVYGGLRYRF